jgi:hypothetical protein
MKSFTVATAHPLDVFGGDLKLKLFSHTSERPLRGLTYPTLRELITCMEHSDGYRF